MAYQKRFWVDKQPSKYIEGLDEEIHTLYDDTDVVRDSYGQIGIVLRNEQEAEAIQALDRVLGPLYDSLPYRIDHAQVLAMPEWSRVIAAARKALAVLLDGDTTLSDLEEREHREDSGDSSG